MINHRRPRRALIAVAVALAIGLGCAAGPTQAAEDTPLARLAASMTVGSWAELKTHGLTPEFLQFPTPVMTYSVLDYQNSGVWDPTSRQVLFIAGPHINQGRFLTYSEATNSWRREPDPPFALYSHTYNHNTINPATGEFFFRLNNQPDIWRYKIATQTWSKLTSIPQRDYNCCGALQYFGERNGLLFVGTSEIEFYDLGRKRWSTPWTTIKTGPYHATAQYSPGAKVLIFGGGSGVRTVYRMDAKGKITQMGDSPYPLDSGGHSIFVADPVSGLFLLFGENRTFYVYDATTDKWTQQDQEAAFFDVGPEGPVYSTIAVPISTHGVVMFISYSPREPRVFLYKHAAAGP